MNENKTLLAGLIGALKSLITEVGGICLIALIVGCLVAPVFGKLIQYDMLKNTKTLTEMSVVYSKMKWVYLILWLIAIASWIVLFALNLH